LPLKNYRTIEYKKIEKKEAINLLKNNTAFVSTIGYEATALVLSQLLETPIAHNRIEAKMKPNDQALVFKPANRLEEGKVLTKKELEDLDCELGLLTCLG
jgi:Domain of unknown function (DUF1874)